VRSTCAKGSSSSGRRTAAARSGAACGICRTERDEEARRTAALRERLLARLLDVRVNGPARDRLPGNLHVSFAGVDAESLMLAVPEVAVSSGSACASGSMEISHVLKAIGMRHDVAKSSIRFGLGRFTTEAEVDEAADRFVAAARRLRAPPPPPRNPRTGRGLEPA
jgi:cysteine desulfurase